MSLTSLLKNDKNLIRLFSVLPDLKPYFKTYELENTYNNKPLVPRIKGADPGRIGTAFDFFCRAFIQRVNNKLIETTLSMQVEYGLAMILDKDFLDIEEWTLLESKVNKIWKDRIKYIKGKEINEDELIKGCLVLANCEFTMRSGKKVESGYLNIQEKDFLDLKNLINKTKESTKFFKTNKGIYLNPKFGEYSRIVGGADADYILNTTLIDIKTTVYARYNKEYIDQLIGYYLLSTYDKSFPTKIEHLGVYLARFNRLVIISIKDIKEVIHLDNFSNYFFDIISNRKNSSYYKLNDEKLKEKIKIKSHLK